MDAESRRKKIIEFLSGADKPVSASKIAKEFKVSRQIIVGDVALIRAAGTEMRRLRAAIYCAAGRNRMTAAA